ncbi:hypothetical protein C7M61_002815 [Candidozyma pseudohaemuli]|uniref:PUM-HD domain-containing protein n=1 Tax=Candidozyma pseudohaemuli TaxID=418784 RepID=A0A2P7YQM9_9ASCO|nr:hypothetical protein C7M61_002815 [[Candida] pseudohaemulonii]PSK38256.1 hypothetical protein C7M61_002815 [[Candida] pseudohaemulonii]
MVISPPTISLLAPQGVPQRSGAHNNTSNGFYGSGLPQNDVSSAQNGGRMPNPALVHADPLSSSIPIPQRDLLSSLALPLATDANTGSLPVPQDAPIALSMLPSGIDHLGLSPSNRPPSGSNGMPGRRVRLGLLFLTMLIWNDDAVSLSPGHLGLSFLDYDTTNLGLAQFISPTLGAQPSSLDASFLSNPTRNRSHTTSGAHPGQLSEPQVPLPFVSSEKPVLFDNLMLNIPDGAGMTRNRSQTYSGVASNLPDLSNPIMLLQQGQARPSNQHPNPPSALHYRPHHDTVSAAVYQPILENDFNFALVVVTTNFENPSLGPTLSLLLDNVPQFMDAAKLWHLIASFPGAVGNPLHGRGVIGIRMSTTSTSKLALVECASIEVAMNLKANFNHLELVPGHILYVAFAKLSERPLSQSFKLNGSPYKAESSNASLKSNSGSLNKPQSRASKLRPQGSTEVDLPAIQDDLIHLVSTLSMLDSVNINRVKLLLKHTMAFPKDKYESNFGPLPDPIPMRQFDSPKLRELRKIFEATEKANSDSPGKAESPDSEPETITQPELEALCLAMLDELPELCYDHIGNTIVQKLFTLVESPLIKLMMVKELAPYLTQFSIHKNGTWAIQKIINLCHNDFTQMTIIAESLKPYTVKLFNDQFGNYVVQCCLKFGSPYNDFIFETMIDNFLEISFGRFGARCIRTILETASDTKSANKGYVSNEQMFLVASMIVEFANELVVNNNGSLLITWFLETFNGCKGLKHDYRYELLCDKFLPHLGHLCTHKLANLTIFNILNNRNDMAVRQKIMSEIFGHFNEHDLEEMSARPPTVLLETILAENQEQSTGPLFIYKIVSNPMLMNIGNELSNARYKQYIIGQVKRVLLEIQITNLQPYKKLVEEVGLATNRLSRSGLTTRKGKRDRRGKTHSPHRATQPMIQPYMQPNQGMPMVYGMPKMPMGEANPGMPPNGYYQPQDVHPGMYNGSNQDMGPLYQQRQQYVQQQQLQDVNVMQQLEQLSLSSAAMGYNSNPDTPKISHGTRFA